LVLCAEEQRYGSDDKFSAAAWNGKLTQLLNLGATSFSRIEHYDKTTGFVTHWHY